MVYHEKKFHFDGTPALEWWAVDTDTLILAKCRVEKGPRFYMDVVRADWGKMEESSHSQPPDPGEAAISILVDCRKHFQKLSQCPAAIGLIDRSEADFPEYLLMGEPGEIPDCIMHTSDPVFISFYHVGDDCEKFRQHLVAYHTRSKLPGAGWKYWCTDARQEFESLVDLYLKHIQETLRSARQTSARRLAK